MERLSDPTAGRATASRERTSAGLARSQPSAGREAGGRCYLRSRGIGESQARGLLTYGFARDILERVELAPLREKLTLKLLDRMPNAEQIREMVQ